MRMLDISPKFAKFPLCSRYNVGLWPGGERRDPRTGDDPDQPQPPRTDMDRTPGAGRGTTQIEGKLIIFTQRGLYDQNITSHYIF